MSDPAKTKTGATEKLTPISYGMKYDELRNGTGTVPPTYAEIQRCKVYQDQQRSENAKK